MENERLETDLRRLEVLARANWRDNWNFRAYLKGYADEQELDRTVHRLHAEVASGIDCTKCANCCREIYPYLSPKDISRMARSLVQRNADFKARYVKREKSGEQVFCQ